MKDKFQNLRQISHYQASWSRPKPRTFAAHVKAKTKLTVLLFHRELFKDVCTLLTQYFIIYVCLKYTSSTLPYYVVKKFTQLFKTRRDDIS